MKNPIKVAVLAMVLIPALVLAVDIKSPEATFSDYGEVLDVLDTVTTIIYTLSFTISVIMALYAAFLFLTAAGDSEKVTKARQTLIYAAIGVAVALVAASVPLVVESILGGSGGGGGYPQIPPPIQV